MQLAESFIEQKLVDRRRVGVLEIVVGPPEAEDFAGKRVADRQHPAGHVPDAARRDRIGDGVEREHRVVQHVVAHRRIAAPDDQQDRR